VRYEFRGEEARVEVVSVNGSVLTIVWPVEDDPYFYFDMKSGMNATRRAQIVEYAPSFGIVPGLTPVENREEVRTEKYINEALGSRLTSRHFRNHLYHLKRADEPEFDRALEFMCDYTPEIFDVWLRNRMSSDGLELDLFFKEAATHSERELFWAGDGLQIWLQVLFHAFRQRDRGTLVLDEPDVFLHPDLQRRLVAMLEDLGPQIILATHAPEVIAEASRDSVVWVDKSTKSGRRVGTVGSLDRVVAELGSAFDLGIARALRSRVALFVEGQDMKLLRLLASAAKARTLSRERSPIAVIPLGGYSNWPLVEPFAWMKTHLLQDAVSMFVILDRDYRTDEECQKVVRELQAIGIRAHVWSRKEIESYVLVSPAISRVSGLSASRCEELLTEAIEEQADEVESCIFSHVSKHSDKKLDPKTTFERARDRFSEAWADPEARLRSAPPKAVLASLNVKLIDAGGERVHAWKIAKALHQDELAAEVQALMVDIEDAVLQRS
jgi:energy-coupling factor transporter ATP-binding protein EcfA2